MHDRLLEAIYFATQKHQSQKRRDNKTPFIVHPLSVALILMKVTDDEDAIIAGILHDILEDTDTSEKVIGKLFGQRVSKLVRECTEEDGTLSWKVRKEAELAKIKNISHTAALIKSADHLQNTFETKKKLQEYGKSFMNNFHASAEDKFKYDKDKLEKLKTYHPNPILKDIESNLKVIKKILEK